MDFSYTEEQQLLQDTVARFIANEYGFEARQRIVASDPGFSRDVWAQWAELGLLGLPFAEEHGGIGGTPVDVMIVQQELGRGLAVEPYLSTVVLGGGAIDLLGSAAQKAALLPAIAQGEKLVALALDEPQSRYVLNDVTTKARRDGNGYVIDGKKAVVLHGASADLLLVSARTAGAQRDAGGISLFVVPRNTAGVTVHGYRTIDGLRAADIELRGVRVDADGVLGPIDGALPAIEHVGDLGAAALCAEAVGVMEALNAATLDYLKTRQQFGQPIGRFQVLQHRAVDMFIHAEQSKSLACLAAVKARSADVAERTRAVSAAKSYIGRAGRAVAKEAIQLHGGMGVTNELPAAHYAKRLTMIDFQLGDADYHAERFAAA